MQSDSHPSVKTTQGPRATDVSSRLEASVELVAGTEGIDYLAHFRNRVFDFSADLLDEREIETEVAEVADGAERFRVACFHVTGQFAYAMLRYDERFRGLNSGALIRLVVQGSAASMFGCSIIPFECLVAVSRAVVDRQQESTNLLLARRNSSSSADIALSAFATRLRRRLSLGSQNPGGYEPHGQSPVAGPAISPIGGLTRDWIAQLFRGVVVGTDLHFVAYSANGNVLVTEDCLDREDLEPFSAQLTVSSRRRRYLELSAQVPGWLRELSRTTQPVIQGGVERVVFDVERGAIYVYRVAPNEFIIGITLVQHTVSGVDDVMAELTSQILAVTGGSEVLIE
jgi:hypothetical protein